MGPPPNVYALFVELHFRTSLKQRCRVIRILLPRSVDFYLELAGGKRGVYGVSASMYRELAVIEYVRSR